MSDDPLNLGVVLDRGAMEDAAVEKKNAKKPTNPVAQKNAETAAKRAETAAKREERMATKGAPEEPEPPPVDKTALLDKITAYRERFPHIKSRNKLSGKSSVEEIYDELHYIEAQLGGTDGHLGTHIFLLGMSAIEEGHKYFNPLDLKLTGLTQIARQNTNEFTPIIDELMIKYGASMVLSPEMRLAMAVGTMVYTVHSANTGNVAVARAMEAMSKNVVPKATDL